MTDAATVDGTTHADKHTPALEVHGVRKTFEAENAPVRALRASTSLSSTARSSP